MPYHTITIAGHSAQVIGDLSWKLGATVEEDMLDSGAPDLTPLGYSAETVSFQCRSASLIAFEQLKITIKAAMAAKTTIAVAGWPLDQAMYNGTFYCLGLSRSEGFSYVDFSIELKKA